MENEQTRKNVVIVGLAYSHLYEIWSEIFKKETLHFIDLSGVQTKEKYNTRLLGSKKHKIIKIASFLFAFARAFSWLLRNRKKIDLLIGISVPTWFPPPFMLLIPRRKIVFFSYDINYFCKELPQSLISRMKLVYFIALEKTMFVLCNKILHKGLKQELKFLPYYHKIKNKPEYLFREFIPVTVQAQEKLSKKDGNIHVVYGGGWSYHTTQYSPSFFDLCKPFIDADIHVHVYTNAGTQEERDLLKAYEQKYKNFHYDGYVNHTQLIENYTRYDFGINFTKKYLPSGKQSIHDTVAFSNKNFDYLCGNLPIIVYEHTTALAQFVKEFGVGYVFNYEKLCGNNAELSSILLDKNNYRIFLTNKDKFIKLHSNLEKIRTFLGV